MVYPEIALTIISGIILAGRRNRGLEGKRIQSKIIVASMGQGRILHYAIHYIRRSTLYLVQISF